MILIRIRWIYASCLQNELFSSSKIWFASCFALVSQTLVFGLAKSTSSQKWKIWELNAYFLEIRGQTIKLILKNPCGKAKTSNLSETPITLRTLIFSSRNTVKLVMKTVGRSASGQTRLSLLQPGFDSTDYRSRRSYVSRISCWFSALLRRIFSEFSGFGSLFRNQQFQIPITSIQNSWHAEEPQGERATSKSCYPVIFNH